MKVDMSYLCANKNRFTNLNSNLMAGPRVVCRERRPPRDLYPAIIALLRTLEKTDARDSRPGSCIVDAITARAARCAGSRRISHLASKDAGFVLALKRVRESSGEIGPGWAARRGRSGNINSLSKPSLCFDRAVG